MLNNKLTAALLGLCLCVPAVMISAPAAQAQDIRIYTHAPEPVDTSDPSNVPLVVLTLDLSILQLVKNGEGALDGFFGALGLGSLVDLDALLTDVNNLVASTGVPNLVKSLGIVKLLLYPLLNQLVGLRVVIMASYADDTGGTGAAVLFTSGKNHLLGEDLSGTLFTLQNLGNVGNALTSSVDPNDSYTLGVPFQGVDIYTELVDYLTGSGGASAPALTADNATAGSGGEGNYISPLTGTCAGTDIYVINVMLSNAAQPDAFAAKVKELEENGFTYNGGQYYIRSSYLLLGGPQAGNGLFGLLHSALGTTNLLLGLTGLGPLLGNQIVPAVYGAATSPAANRSLLSPQPVQNHLAGGNLPLYLGRFTYTPDANHRAWTGALAKISFDPGNLGNTTVEELPWPGDVTKTNAACTGTQCAEVYYQEANGTVAALNLDTDTIKDICGANNGGGCNDTYLTADDKLAAAKQIAWARGYKVRREALSPDEYKGLLGLLNGVVGAVEQILEDTLQAITGLLSGILGDNTGSCNHTGGGGSGGGEDCGLFGLGCLLENLIEGLTDLLNSIVSGVLGLNFDSCDIPAKDAPPARDYMGDILHSTPLAIDYGGNKGVRIFFGTNTGFLHQFSAETESEVWRFAPKVTMKHFAVWSAGEFEKAHGPYGVDGAPIAYIKNTGDAAIKASEGDRVILYFGLRRGGKRYYALDVTKPDQKPTLVWMISPSDPGFANLGWTFSMPAIGKVYGNDGEKHVVLIFGGGYDKSNDPPAAVGHYPDVTCDTSGLGGQCKDDANDEMGTALYVVDATTGDLIWKAARNCSGTTTGYVCVENKYLTDSIPSAPTAVDTSGDGLLDYVYVGDTGGQVWRAKISSTDPSNWTMSRIANLGRHYKSKVTHDRRFFHPPDVVRVSNGKKTFRLVVIASGNRAAPLKTQTQNWLYVLIDRKNIPFPIVPQDMLIDVHGGNCSEHCGLLDPKFPHAGWKLKLGKNKPGEKALSSPITLNGTIILTTYVPPATSSSSTVCTPQEGRAKLYAVQLTTGDPAKWSTLSKPIDPRGIPSTVQYVGSGRFLARDYTSDPAKDNYFTLKVNSRRVWRIYWRTRKSPHL